MDCSLPEQATALLRSALDSPTLRDELYVQLLRQGCRNTCSLAKLRWAHLLVLVTHSFAPSAGAIPRSPRSLCEFTLVSLHHRAAPIRGGVARR